MRQLVPLFIALLALIGCASAPPHARVLPPVVALASVQPPMPVFEIQHNWVIVKTEGNGPPGTVALVSLERQELGGMMRVFVLPAGDDTPESLMTRIRAVADEGGDVVTTDAPAPVTAIEAAFLWKASQPADDPMHGKILIVRMKDHPEYLVMCAGTWPESAMEFLVSPLHATCASVRPPP